MPELTQPEPTKQTNTEEQRVEKSIKEHTKEGKEPVLSSAPQINPLTLPTC
jgi:hypothetical protein